MTTINNKTTNQENKTETAKPAAKKATSSEVIYKTATRTLALLVVFTIFVGSLYILFNPLSAGRFLYSMGLKSFSANITLKGAYKSDEFDDYFDAFTRAVSCKNHRIVIAAGDKMLSNSSFTSKISKHNISDVVSVKTYDAESYVEYNYIYSSVVKNKGFTSELFDKAKSFTKMSYGSYYYYRSYNAISGIISALVDNPDIEIADILDRLEDIYYNDNEDESWSLAYRYDNLTGYQSICLDAMRIIDSRSITGGVRDKWVAFCKARQLDVESKTE